MGMTAEGFPKAEGGQNQIAKIRAPAMAKEGEALALIAHFVAVQNLWGMVWIIIDLEAATGALTSYLQRQHARPLGPRTQWWLYQGTPVSKILDT